MASAAIPMYSLLLLYYDDVLSALSIFFKPANLTAYWKIFTTTLFDAGVLLV